MFCKTTQLPINSYAYLGVSGLALQYTDLCNLVAMVAPSIKKIWPMSHSHFCAANVKNQMLTCRILTGSLRKCHQQ